MRNVPWLLAAIVLAALTGCSGDGGTVAGVVRFEDGEPVQSGSVEFRSLADGERYASKIDHDGAFALTDQKGRRRCPAGKYEVVVVQMVITEDLAAHLHDHGRTVPREYADYYTSKLRVTKEPDQETPLEVVLPWEEEEDAEG